MDLTECGITSHVRELKRELLAVMGASADCASHAQTPCARNLPQNVVGVGYGVRQGAATDEVAVRVYVRRKLPTAALRPSDRVPPTVNGIATDVIAVGDVRALMLCGSPCGHRASEMGTIGCLVRNPEAPGGECILSNHHVLGAVNEAVPGHPIFTLDNGGHSSAIARLAEFERIDFTGINHIDAAIAEVLVRGAISPEIVGIGSVRQPSAEAALNQRVRKHGSATRLTDGKVVDIAADIDVRYGSRTAVFVNQIGIEGMGSAFARGGDSGSLVVDATTRRALALLFAGGERTAFANPIGAVLDRFSVEIL
jgi:hypothetical protein